MGREFELKYAATAADLEKLKARYPHLRPIAMETPITITKTEIFPGCAGPSAAGWKTETVSAH